MICIVCGGRNFTDSDLLFAEMDRVHRERPITLVVEGGQRKFVRGIGIVGGADYWASEWAKTNGVPTVRENALWGDLSHPDARIKKNSRGKDYDANAGFRRNALMITKHSPAAVIAFKGGNGTQDMVDRGVATELEIIDCRKAA